MTRGDYQYPDDDRGMELVPIDIEEIRLTPEPDRQGRGCVLLLSLIFGGIAIFSAVSVISGMRYASEYRRKYTSETPVPLPTPEWTAEEADDLRRRIRTFGEAIDSGAETEPLVLSGRELNILIMTEESAAKLKDRMFVTVRGDRIQAELSIPLPGRMFRGRYLNGAARIFLRVEEGEFRASLREITVDDRPLPEKYGTVWAENDILSDLNLQPAVREAARAIHSVEVADGFVFIHGVPPAPAE